jgi:hypothetical protein
MQIGGTRHIISNNRVFDNGTSGIDPKGIRLVSATNCIIEGNICSAIGNAHQQYGIAEEGTSDNNTIVNNDLRNNATAAVLTPNLNGNSIYRGNRGYNPSGAVSTPGFPATTVAVTNATGSDVVAYITNGAGALTIQVDAVTALMVIPANSVGTVRIPARSTFTPTYGSGAPTWKWYGE